LNAGINLAVALVALPTPVVAQSFLEQFSYEGIRLTGISAEVGAVWSDRLSTEVTPALRFDFGYVAPHVRVLLGASYFKGTFTQDQIATFEQRLLDVIDDPLCDATVNIGTITWANFDAAFDMQYVFTPGGVIQPYAGLGLALIVRDGDGDAIQGTFVEDALDTFSAGVTASLGVEVRVTRSLYLLADGRGLLSSELRALTARGGVKFLIPRSGS
jgi:hypothetical protein